MSSSKSRIKILLDTTYLLPVVGIDVDNLGKILTILKKLHELEEAIFYYTPFNILEILGKLSRMRYDEERVRIGLRSIKESFKITHPTVVGYMRALKLRRKGFKDLIDLLLYATSRTRKLTFLTRDKDLIEFLRSVGEGVDNIVYEEEFIKKYSKYLPPST